MNLVQSNLGGEADNETTAQGSQMADSVNIWYTKPTQIDLQEFVINSKVSSKDIPR